MASEFDDLPQSAASGNTTNDSFGHAKKMLSQVYADHRVTLYCGASYDERGNVILPEGFITPKHEKRAAKIEWEHSLPAENFGKTFEEWRTGAPECFHEGKPFKGRKCAEKANIEYRYMQADMYNLFPAIGQSMLFGRILTMQFCLAKHQPLVFVR